MSPEGPRRGRREGLRPHDPRGRRRLRARWASGASASCSPRAARAGSMPPRRRAWWRPCQHPSPGWASSSAPPPGRWPTRPPGSGSRHLQVHGDADPDGGAPHERAAGHPGHPRWTGPRRSRARGRAPPTSCCSTRPSPACTAAPGTAFDWSLLEDDALGRPFALAGGLRPDNVGAALARLRPVLVDVSSGVESLAGPQGPRPGRRVRRRGRRRGAGGRMSERAHPRRRAGRPATASFGGRYVPETVIGALDELTEAYLRHRDDPAFRAELDGLLDRYVGRPTPLYRAKGLEARLRHRARLPQARGPLPHRRAQDQQRPRAGAARVARWARSASSPRPAPASTASPPPPPPRCSASTAASTWAASTWPASASTSSACGCSAPRCGRSTRASGRSRTPSTRPSATG